MVQSAALVFKQMFSQIRCAAIVSFGKYDPTGDRFQPAATTVFAECFFVRMLFFNVSLEWRHMISLSLFL